MPNQDTLRPLRVLQVTPRFYPHVGGIETHVYEVGRRLAARGVDVSVLTTDVDATLDPEEMIEGIRVRRVPAWPARKDYYFAPGIWREMMLRKWDVVHCQGAHTLVAPIGMYAAQRAGLPYVVSFHTGGATTAVRRVLRGAQWQALRPLFARASRLIGPSTWETEQFRMRLRLPRAQFAVIPNGAQRLPDVTPTPLAPRPDPEIVSVGRLVRYKGHQRVIAAMPHVLRSLPGARLRIVGMGIYESALREQVERLGLAERVVIAGVPPDDQLGIASIVARSDLVTLLSEHEAQGIAVLEALALGRPVLVADTTALHELVAQGQARSVPLDATPEQVAEAILSQLRSPLVPPRITFPSWERCAQDLLAVYQDVVRTPCGCP